MKGLQQKNNQSVSGTCAVRDASVFFGKHGKGARGFVSLIEQLSDEDPSRRAAAASALGKKGDRRAAKPLLKAALLDADPDVRNGAASAFRNIPGRSKFLHDLETELNAADPNRRVSAVIGLGRIGDGRALKALKNRLKVEANDLVKPIIEDAIKEIRNRSSERR